MFSLIRWGRGQSRAAAAEKVDPSAGGAIYPKMRRER